MEKTVCIVLLPLAAIAYFVQGKVSSAKLVVFGVLAMLSGLGLAVAGTLTPAICNLSGAAVEVFAVGCGAISIFGVLIAVPAFSDIIFQRRNVE